MAVGAAASSPMMRRMSTRGSPPEPAEYHRISGDGNHAIGGAGLLEYVKNRLAGGTGRLAVIAHAFGQSPIRASAHGGIRHVSGFRMLLTDRGHERERLSSVSTWAASPMNFGLFFDERIVGGIVGRVENRLHERVPVVDWLGGSIEARGRQDYQRSETTTL